jgi:hypothetical protein
MTTITTGTSGPQAWKIALVAGAVGLATLIAVNLPQNTSDTTGEQVAATATATLPESVTGFEYNNESTSGQVASPGVTTPYSGYSDELFPYENGPAPQTVPNQAEIDALTPVITQEFLDGPSSATQGATRVAPTPDSIADAQDRAEAAQIVSAPSLAVSDEALVNPVPEVDAAQLIQDIIAAERAARAPSIPGTSFSANANAEAGVNARSDALREAHHNGTLLSNTNPSYVSPQWQAYIDAVSNGSASAYFQSSVSEPLIDGRVNGDPYFGGTSDDALTRRPTGVDSADIKYLEASPKPSGTQRILQSNLPIR